MTKRPVTESALIQRLRRRFARDGETFHITRGERWRSDLGSYHAVDAGNYVCWKCDSLEDLERVAREVGVLAESEAVAS